MGIEECDDANCDEVINHGECQEEYPQCAGQMRTDQGQDGDGEGDVRGCRDRPPPQRFGTGQVDHGVDEGGNSDPTGGSRDWHDGLAGFAQIPDQELALKFKADEEKEDGQQSVRRPLAEAEFEMPRRVSDPGIPQLEVAGRQRGVCPDQRDDRSHHQQRAADSLFVQDGTDAQQLRRTSPSEQEGAGAGIR